MSVESEFRVAMMAAGIKYDGPIHADGKLHRVRFGGYQNPDGWYVLHGDGIPFGAFGDWKTGAKGTWNARIERIPRADYSRLRREQEERQRIRLQEELIRHENARAVATSIFAGSRLPDRNHPYLLRKRIGIHGDLRQQTSRLVIPLRDADGELHSLQYIDADGTKKYLAGGRASGVFFTLSQRPDGPLVITEGFATAATVLEATGYATVAAMNCGNLLPVALAIRGRWPTREIIIAGDDDRHTPGNPGLTKAREAAKAIDACFVVPQFKTLSTDEKSH